MIIILARSFSDKLQTPSLRPVLSDFTRSQLAEFAVEFQPVGPISPAPGPASCSLEAVRWSDRESASSVGLDGNGAWGMGPDPAYELVGSVVYEDANTWVDDFGLCAYCSERPPAG
jgi:hypothetical protein